MERKILTDAAPRRRAVLTDAGVTPVVAPAQGVLDLGPLVPGDVADFVRQRVGQAMGAPPQGNSWASKTPEQVRADVGAAHQALVDKAYAREVTPGVFVVGGVGGWRLGMAPPCSGWWDYAIDGTDETGRMWYQAEYDRDGFWYEDQWNWAAIPVCRHSDVAGTMRWRGLNAPWPEGYRYPVPAPGRRYRARLS